jgi:hypothetical protein
MPSTQAVHKEQAHNRVRSGIDLRPAVLLPMSGTEWQEAVCLASSLAVEAEVQSDGVA